MTQQADPAFANAVYQVLSDTLNLPQQFVDYMVQYQALNGLPIPVSQITGFRAGLVAGVIPPTGTIPTAGTGFTYTHTGGTGVYVFTFTTAFSAVPAVLLTPNSPATQAPFVNISAGPSKTGFTAHFTTSAGADVEVGFSFLASTAIIQ